MPSTHMMRLFLAAALWAASATAQVPVEQLAKPPVEAKKFSVVSPAGEHGHAELWTLPDGTRMSRFSQALRGMVSETDAAATLGPDGMPASFTIRGFTPSGDAGETFHIFKGKAVWKSQLDAGEIAYSSPRLYYPTGGDVLIDRLMIESLVASPTHSVKLLPGGEARAERLAELEIGQGKTRRTVVCWAVSGLFNSSYLIWVNKDGSFFGTAMGMGILPTEYAGELTKMMAAQDDALAKRSPALVKTLVKAPTGPVAFTHVRAFLDGKRFAEDQTVVIQKGVINQVGPSASIPVPKDATVIDGRGKTLVPGLWESHMHIGDDSTGPFLLSLGVTSARDPGNDDAATIARARRRARGELLMPKVYASSMIDGKGPNTAQVANVASTLEEALVMIQKAKANGFTGVKLYGTFNPAWVKPAAAEAHRLGLHVHGHVPAGMRPHEAIEAGYDELTHIYFVMMEAMPEDVLKTSNGMNRFDGPGRYAKDVDLGAEPMKSLLATMAKHKTVADPTLVVVEGIYTAENGIVGQAYLPYMGTLPLAMERGFRSGGFTIPKDLTLADYKRSFAKLVALVGAMHKTGIPIVAGTDGSGLELVRELELYMQAGFTPEEALASATLVPARMVGADQRTGSIEVGKAADLVLVEGDPSIRMGDLRNTRLVVMDGNLMDADALRSASGFSGRPKTMSAQ